VSANKQAKALGLKNLIEVSELTGRNNRNTFHNWYNTSPELFNIVLLGCIKAKKLKEQGVNESIFDKNLSIANQVKAAGLKSIEEMVYLVQKHRNTIRGWHKRHPTFFTVILLGCVEFKNKKADQC